MTTWTQAAAQFADALPEPGFGLAGLVASAWCANVDPYATRSLVSAAHVLAGHEVMRRLWDRVDPCPSDQALLEGAEQAEADIAGLLRHAAGMADECARARDRAAGDYGDASGAAFAAAGTRAAQDAAAAAQQRMRDAGAAIDDCDAALEVLCGVRMQLAAALDALRQVPAEVAETYETAYSIVCNGGKLPHSGHFLTGAA